MTANRAVMVAPELAEAVLRGGRHPVGPVVEDLLGRAHAAGLLDAPDPADAFTELYGLVVRDTQVRVLLGEPAPSRRQVRAQARAGIEAFRRLRPAARDTRTVSRGRRPGA